MTGAVGAVGAASATQAPRKSGGMSFGEFLSCLNPLQYVPVVGTIYRAVTGDTIPAPVRAVGALVFSGMTSGPVGIGISLGIGAVERAVGFDEEKFGQGLLASIGIGKGNAPAGPAMLDSAPAAPATLDNAPAARAGAAGGQAAFTAADLARFGLTQSADGSLSGNAGAGLSGADALNAMELGRIATTAYARAGALLPAA